MSRGLPSAGARAIVLISVIAGLLELSCTFGNQGQRHQCVEDVFLACLFRKVERFWYYPRAFS